MARLYILLREQNSTSARAKTYWQELQYVRTSPTHNRRPLQRRRPTKQRMRSTAKPSNSIERSRRPTEIGNRATLQKLQVIRNGRHDRRQTGLLGDDGTTTERRKRQPQRIDENRQADEPTPASPRRFYDGNPLRQP